MSDGLWLIIVSAISLTAGLLIGAIWGRQRQRRQLESFKHDARTDSLTGLLNRRRFEEILGRRVGERQRRKNPVSLILLDVDQFKSLNDRYGHSAGDAVLRGIAKILSDQIRQSDFAARLGGDEFAVGLPGTDLQDAGYAAERMRQLIAAQPILFEKTQIRTSISIGAAATQPGESAKSLYSRADQAVYAAKQAGRNNSHIHDNRGCQRFRVGKSPCNEPG